MVLVPRTVTRSTHAVTIRADRRIIGAIHSFAPSMGRTIDTEFEVGSGALGMPVDLVPQTVDRRELRINRYDTYPEIMEEVFGTAELFVLADQYRPFSIREVWKGPGINPLAAGNAFGAALGGFGSLANAVGAQGAANRANALAGDVFDAVGAAQSSAVGRAVLTPLGILSADVRIYEYQYCYFQDIGRELDSKSDRVVNVNATLIYKSKIRVQ